DGVWIDEGAQNLTDEPALAAAVLTVEAEYRIWSARAHGREQPRDGHGEVRVGAHVHKRPQRRDRAAALGVRQRQHAARSPEAHGRVRNNGPARSGDANGLPIWIGQIDEDIVAMTGDARVNGAHG